MSSALVSVQISPPHPPTLHAALLSAEDDAGGCTSAAEEMVWGAEEGVVSVAELTEDDCPESVDGAGGTCVLHAVSESRVMASDVSSRERMTSW